MPLQTILLLLLAAIGALAIVAIQYFYKKKKSGTTIFYLSFLRFIALFGLFVLLINPKFTKISSTIEKTNLVILVDHSSSVSSASKTIETALNTIHASEALKNKFNIQAYTFGERLQELDSLSFNEKQTDISKALNTISEIHNKTKLATILLTDGNQTLGQDYEFYGKKLKSPVFPMAIGDTTRFEDVYISKVNTNKYAFLKNKFPIEFYVVYEGIANCKVPITILVDGQSVFSKSVELTKSNNSEKISTFLEANTIGVKKIEVRVGTLQNEKNIQNNLKTLALEVIDEKTNVGIISSLSHPDIGALKKAIESNEQRSVRIFKPSVSLAAIDAIDIFIFYQPDISFKPVYDFIQNKKASVFIIEGPKTDLNFLNRAQNSFQIDSGYPVQEVFATNNRTFSYYDISDFAIDNFPPLLTKSGPTTFLGVHQTILQMQIKGVNLPNPLLATSEFNGAKTALFFGEGLWKWRLQSYRNVGNFENFDEFIGKLILFLSDNKKKNRLNVSYQSVYEGASGAQISATYFDETFVFDPNANLSLKLNNDREVPMLLKGDYYEADLSDLRPGEYSFVVKVSNSNLSKTGSFSILDFDVEQQFNSTNYKKLEKLAQMTNGKLLFPDQMPALLSELNTNNLFLPVQKSNENVVSLIDFRILLILIVVALSAEWFIRKFNGLT